MAGGFSFKGDIASSPFSFTAENHPLSVRCNSNPLDSEFEKYCMKNTNECFQNFLEYLYLLPLYITEGRATWTVARKYTEFYTLEQKLKEFHGEMMEDCLLPSKKIIGTKNQDFIDGKREPFEQYLQVRCLFFIFFMLIVQTMQETVSFNLPKKTNP